MQNTKTEEIQAKRGFFKSASKGAMPMMTLLDVATTASLFGGAGCDCYGGCGTACSKHCSIGCTTTCGGSCGFTARYGK